MLAVQPQGKARSGSCPGNWDSEALDETPGKAAGRWCPELQENKALAITNTPYAAFTPIFLHFIQVPTLCGNSQRLEM